MPGTIATVGSRRFPFAALVCLIVGLLGTLPLVVLTPPFQVPDEPAQFERAYWLSEGHVFAMVRDGMAGGIEPRSIPRLVRHFLGTDALLATRRANAAPFGATLAERAVPLVARRREFVNFTDTAAYAPFGYLPATAFIAIGRGLGAGPLGLLYAARLANALLALAMLAAAVRLMPLGRATAAMAGLLPMALFEYASASQDALVIGGCFLLTALGLRALQRGTWRRGEVAAAMLAGLLACATKLVYLPLLLIAAPAAFDPANRSNQLRALGALCAVVLGVTALWLLRDSARVIAYEPGAAIHAQAVFVAHHPLRFTAAVARSWHRLAGFYALSGLGAFGWLTVAMPLGAYFLIGAALLASCLAAARDETRLPPLQALWCVILLVGAVLLTFLAMYVDATPVGGKMVLGVQGRYFIPLLPLVGAAVSALPLPRLGLRAAGIALSVLAGVAAVDAAVATEVIVRAFGVF